MINRTQGTHDAMQVELERGLLWDRAIAGIGEGKGRDAREFIQEVATKMGLEL